MKRNLYFFLFLFSLSSFGQMFDTSMWIPNGPVHDVVKYNNELIIGGDFSYLGTASGYGIPLDTATGLSLDPLFPRVDGPVYCAFPDSWGGWYIGGKFNAVGGQARRNFAHISKTGHLYPNFNPSPDGPVYAIWIQPSNGATNIPFPKVYIGGDFTFVGGLACGNLAVLNPYTGNAYPNWKPIFDGPVYCIEPRGTGTFLIGGAFNKVDTYTRNNFAEVTQLNGNLNGAHSIKNLILSFNNPVYAIRYSRKNIYIGGEFTTVENQAIKYLAKFNLINGSLISSFGVPNGPVYCFGKYGYLTNFNDNSGPPPPGRITQLPDPEMLQAYDSTLYIGGFFTLFAGQPHNCVVRIDTVLGLPVSFSCNTNSTVNTITISPSNGDVFIGGQFTLVNNQPRRFFAAVDSLGTLKPNVVFDCSDPVRTLALNDSLLYVGGDFVCYNGVLRNNLAAIDLNTKKASTTFLHGADDVVRALLISPDYKLYVGGDFLSLDNQFRQHVGSIDLITNLVTVFSANTNGTVRALCLINNKLYFGGFFSTVNTVSRVNLGAVNVLTNALVNWYPSPNGTVNSLSAGQDRIFVGGFFSSIGGNARTNLASVDTLGGNCVTGFNANVNDGVYDLFLENGRLFSAGWFTSAGGQNRNNIAQLDHYSALASGFNPDCDSYVRSIGDAGPSTIVIGGNFTTVSGQPRNHMAFLDKSNGTLLSLDPDANRQPLGYLKDGNILYTGGEFTSMDGWVHPFLVAINLSYVPGTPELKPQEEFSVFPNPSDGNFYLDLRGLKNISVAVVFNRLGQQVMQVELSKNENLQKISLGDLSPGLYFMSISGENGVITKKIIIY